MPSLGFPELIIILVIALIVFGPGKLPTVGAAIGKALNEFKKASKELTKDNEVINAREEDKDKDSK